MAKPNNQKDMKPKENNELVKVPIDNNLKLVFINILAFVLIGVLIIGINYVLQDNLLNKKLADISTEQNSDDEDEVADEDEVQKGIIVDLGDFILNLNDQGQKKYLKVNVALELTRIPTDYDPSKPVEKKEGHGGGDDDPMKMIEMEMAQYKPAIRDAVITNFSSKTSDEVMTAAGKELVKEQITEDVNAIFAGEREVIRVSFGQFIIQ